MYETIKGGFQIRDTDQVLLSAQRALTKQVNEKFIQVAAVWLKQSSKNPIAEDWAKSGFRDVDLQTWIDDPDYRYHNTGFNLQFGWTDIDIDCDDPEYNACLIAALEHLGVDTRFRFGRRSVGYPTHVLVQLGEDESSNFETLKKFEPREFVVDGKRYKTQLRSYSTSTTRENVNKTAQQTVMPGSIYSHKKIANEYDISVWYDKLGKIAENVTQIAGTTPRRASFNQLVRAIAFATLLYVVKDRWVEGSRQETATRVAGWLARVVRDSSAMNNHEVISADVWCPIDDDTIVESLIKFICDYQGDEEPHMRARTYFDAQGKLSRNPDAKVPGWPAMEQMFGMEKMNALRAVFTPGSDVSVLNMMAERYIYDETDNMYIDRKRHAADGKYVHQGEELSTRHKGDIVRIGGKPKEAFRVYESSDMRKRIDLREMFPELEPGVIFRLATTGTIVGDEDDEEGIQTVFNTWRGWPVKPIDTVDADTMRKCESMLDQLLMYLTRDNRDQVEWHKDWWAWTFQHPGMKQQIAPVIVGGQGVGKSWYGNVFAKALLGRLWGSASPKVMEGAFSVEPFIDKLFVFIDEAKFNGDGSVDEIKKLIRNVDVGGAEKFSSSRNHRIFSRVAFAANRYNIGVGQTGLIDRALFYSRTYDHEYMNTTELAFRSWSETLKPWFDEFNAMMESTSIRRHFVRYFMDRKVDRHSIESIRFSSSTDPLIMGANMSWPRQIAKRIIEEGRIIEDMAIEVPFIESDLNLRVAEMVKELGMRNVQSSYVLREFEQAGVLTTVTKGFKKYRTFKYRIGTLTEKFGEAIGMGLNSRYEFDPEKDFGDNDTEVGARMEWKGARNVKF